MQSLPKILQKRTNFRPFLYPQAFDIFEKQQKAHWTPSEVEMDADVHQYHTEFSEKEKHAVTTILKIFTQTENIVADYWTNVVGRWFVQPEICMMANTFASFEAIHAQAYDKLNTALGLDSKEFYLSFLEDETLKKKTEFIESKMEIFTEKDLPLSLAVFSGFTEGVSLFSSFAILLNFQRFNKLKDVANIISWSIRDESLHSSAGCWLFRTLVSEMNYSKQELINLESQIKEVAEQIHDMEMIYIDKIFLDEELEGLSKIDMKNFIKHRINQKMRDLGFNDIYNNLPTDKVGAWFNPLNQAVEFVDFFEARSTNYVKGWNFGNINW